MAKHYPEISDAHREFVEAQHIFFSGSAAPEGRVNVSPKGMDSLRILGPNRVLWLNLTGSGNETAAHLTEDPRMTLMWCSFSKRPLILRMYGTAHAVHRTDARWEELYALFPSSVGARQIFDMTVDLVQTSCGYAVPFMEFAGERDTLTHWNEDKGAEGIEKFWAEKNAETLDGKPTDILALSIGETE
ncbi:MAG: pyridoxamine 5'-phosphate oxidase family protein [Litoreibacter sp.]|nr:pyridoxamine 5'-phosphate oxidase family protein [Litoreibacter sp.]